MKKLTAIALMILILGIHVNCENPKQSQEIKSPNGKIFVEVKVDQTNRLTFTLKQEGILLLPNSPIGVHLNGSDVGKGVSISKARINQYDEMINTRGNHFQIRDYFNEMTIPIKHIKTNQNYELKIRVYDNGIAYCSIIPGEQIRSVTGESGIFQLSRNSTVWYHSATGNYESIYKSAKANQIEQGVKIAPPLVAKLPMRQTYLAITEAALFNYSGMTFESAGGGKFIPVFEDDPDGWEMSGTITTPWRIIMIAENLNELVNNDIVTAVCPPPEESLQNAGWIQPGRALWSWWSEGTGDWNLQKKYVDAANSFGFEYILIDEGWENWHTGSKDKWQLLKEVIQYARERDVQVWVWKRWNQISDAAKRKEFFQKLHQLGIVGVKIDFMDSESKERIDFYTNALRDAAENKLMVNFHGANKPTGESRTWPNEMTREGIFGLEQNRYEWGGIPPEHNVTLPFTRLLVGHADYTPCTFDSAKVSGTTFVHQLATTIVFTSPVTHWADRPENYLNSSVRDVIQTIPTVWDETIVLPGSEIGETAAFARRTGDKWFVGILNGDKKTQFEIRSSFLDSGNYKIICLEDEPGNRFTFRRTENVANSKENLRVEMLAGGGFVAIFEETNLPECRLSMSPDGGYLNRPLKVHLATNDVQAEIRYTLNGSRPTANSILYEHPLEINKPLELRAAVFENGQYRAAFMKRDFKSPPAPSISPVIPLFIDENKITISAAVPDGDIRYTLDGSEPNVKSQKYDGEFTIIDTTTIKAKVFWENGFTSKTSLKTYTMGQVNDQVDVEGLKSGIKRCYYEGEWKQLPQFNKLQPLDSTVVATFNIMKRKADDNFGFKFTGYIKVPEDGVYRFYTNSDDGSQLFLHDHLVVDNDGLHGMAERSGLIGLKKGWHPFVVTFFELSGGEGLEVYYQPPDGEKQLLPTEILGHK